MARKCIFCGGQADSHEHVWPKWILAISPTRKQDSIRGHTGERHIFIHGPNAELKTRHVCRTKCNNGWMSKLETAAKAAMMPLILDKPTTVSTHDQGIIINWMIKTIMVAEYTGPVDRRQFRPGDRNLVMEHWADLLAVPAIASAWLCRYVGHRYSTFLGGVQLGADDKDPTGGVVYTFTIGKLAMQFLTIRPKHNRPVRVPLRSGPWDRALLDIWPVRAPVSWPPPLSLGDSGNMSLERLMTRVGRGSLQAPFRI